MIKKSAIILLLAICQLAVNAQQTYKLDLKKSKIVWDTRKTMGGHRGYIYFNSGILNYTPGGEPDGGSFMVNMNSMQSNDHKEAAANERVDKELRTAGFFAIEQYPTATVAVKQIVRIGQSTNFKVTGDLTIKGITNPIEFKATIDKKQDIINAVADLTIDRLRWHIDMQAEPQQWNLFSAVKSKMISDEIAISLNLVFVK